MPSSSIVIFPSGVTESNLLNSERTVSSVTALFNKFDSVTPDGKITIDELGNAMVIIAQDYQMPYPSQQDIENAMRESDTDSTEYLDYDQFKTWAVGYLTKAAYN